MKVHATFVFSVFLLVTGVFAAQAAVPDAPSRVRQVRVDEAHVRITWRDNSGNEDGFEILRQAVFDTEFESRGTVGADVTEFLDETPKGTVFIYRVVAINEDGDSRLSNECYVNRARPGKPVYFNVRLIGLNVARVRWSDRSNGEGGFSLERADFPSRRFKTIARIPPNTEVYDDYTLDPANTYTYRLRALGRPAICWRHSLFTPERTLTTKGGVRILEVELRGLGKGKVTSNPFGISCSPKDDHCAWEFPLAEDIVLKANPNSTSRFAGWADYGRCDGSKNTECVVTMNDNVSIGAAFKKNR